MLIVFRKTAAWTIYQKLVLQIHEKSWKNGSMPGNTFVLQIIKQKPAKFEN